MCNVAKSFDILQATSLNVLPNYFDGPTKLLSDLYTKMYSESYIFFLLYNIISQLHCFQIIKWRS